LFALRWILDLWVSGLPEKDRRRSKDWTVGEIIGQPHEEQMQLPQLRNLDDKIEMMIAAGSTLVARKRLDPPEGPVASVPRDSVKNPV
jgi:hypothetical protein